MQSHAKNATDTPPATTRISSAEPFLIRKPLRVLFLIALILPLCSAAFPQGVFPATTLRAEETETKPERKSAADRAREREERKQQRRERKAAKKTEKEDRESEPKLKNNALNAMKRLRKSTPARPYSAQEQAAVDALYALTPSETPLKNFDKAAIKILFEHSDQFRRFAPDVRAQILWLVDNADEMYVEGDQNGNAVRLTLNGKPNKQIRSFELYIELHHPEDKNSPQSLFLNPQRQALLTNTPRLFPIFFMPHGDCRRSPAIDSRTGKPYVAVPAKLLDALSGEDRDYVSFFAYSLNDAIHAAFGTPLPPANPKDWLAGKYFIKIFHSPEHLYFGMTLPPHGDGKVKSGFSQQLSSVGESFPVQKKVFDDLTENIVSSLATQTTSPIRHRTPLIPIWGCEKDDWHQLSVADLCDPYELELGKAGVSPAEELWYSQKPEPTCFYRIAKRVDAALLLLEELKAMREHLIQRDYSTREAAGTTKGKAMLALFENLRKTEIGLAKVLLKNTKLEATSDPKPGGVGVERRTELGTLYFPEDVIEDNGGSIIFCESLFPGYSDEPWTLLDPEGRTRKAYEKRLAEHEKKFPPVLKGEPMILEGLRRRERAAAATNAEK